MCSITVNITNNTEQSPVTFNSFSFLNETKNKFSPNSVPFIVACNIQANGVAVQALYAEGYSTKDYSDVGLVVTSGTGLFNMPNGDTLTIIWDLNPQSSKNKPPTCTPSSNAYDYEGISSPVITNGDDYVFNLVIS